MAKREHTDQTQDSPPTKRARTSCDPLTRTPRELRRYARSGGPDLTFLRGLLPGACKMGGSSSSSSRSQFRRTVYSKRSTDDTSVSSKRPSASDSNFERILAGHNIFSDGYGHRQQVPIVQHANATYVQQRLAKSRASLSPSRRENSEFEQFRQANTTALSESEVMSRVLPFLKGHGPGPKTSCHENLVFNNLASLTNGATVDPKPDMYDGVPFTHVRIQVREDLDTLIVPTRHTHAGIAPNFFIEAKSSLGLPHEGKRQITHDIAAGTRAMNALQNYKEVSTAPYDGHAYTLGATYHTSGLLKIYAGHVHPGHGQAEPATHVTQVKGFDMTDDADTYFKGVGAFRNARDLARDYRNDLIQSSNSKAQAAGSQVRQSVMEDCHEAGEEPSTITRPSTLSGHAARTSSSRTRTSTIRSTRYKTRSKREPSPSSQSQRKRRSQSGKRT